MRSRCLLVLLAAMGSCAEDGKDGSTVAVTDLAAGNRDCPLGGVRVDVDGEEHFVCNGASASMEEPTDTGFRPVSVVNCDVVTRLPNGISARFSYNVVSFSDGSSFITCSVDTTGIVSGDNSHWYAPWQVGAGARACAVVSDAASPASSGWWDFQTAGGGYRATYHDPNTTIDGWSYQFTTANCPQRNP